MKRICYLLLWLLTGFSIAANQSSQPDTYLFAHAGSASGKDLEPEEPRLRNLILPSAKPEKMEIVKNLDHNNSLICSTKR